MEEDWLVPFKGRNPSGANNQNFLWHRESIYIMDNHRAALWCWLQHLSKCQKYNLIHIDRHTDTLYSRIDEWKEKLPDIEKQTIHEYLNFSYYVEHMKIPLIRFDNYLSLFLECYGDLINDCVFATEPERGDKPRFDRVDNVSIWNIPDNLERWLSESDYPWIFNLDLDFFYCDYEDTQAEDITQQIMFSDHYIESIFKAISRKYQDGKIVVLTVCLSPEFSGGWMSVEKLLGKFCSIMGLDFILPE